MADQWKMKAYHRILKSVIKGETKIGVLIKLLIEDKETAFVKNDPDFVKKIVNDILSEPIELRGLKEKMFSIDDKKVLTELSSLVQKDLGVNLQVFSESDPQRYDPKNRARAARPFKPAIFIE